MALPDFEGMREVLETFLEKGWKLPFHFAGIATNGAMVMGSYEAGEDGLDCQIRGSYCPSGNFALPVNWMVTDQEGQAARVVFEKSGKAEWLH